MMISRSFGLNIAVILVICPILTPRNSTGEPTDSPVIDPEKNITKVGRFWKHLPDPKTVTPMTARAMAPTTNAPMSVFFASLAMAGLFAPGQEGEHPRIVRLYQQLLRVA